MSQYTTFNSAHPRPSADAPPPYTRHSTNTPSETASTPPSTIASLSSIRSGSSTPTLVSDSKFTPQQQPVFTPQEPEYVSDEVTATLPTNVSRARAPLQIRKENASINSSFLVIKSETSGSRTSPDISLQTANARISSAVYIDANEWGRPAVIEAETKNGSISLKVHTLHPDQPVDIRATTKNASNNVLLPRTFKGLLRLSTKHGKDVLSPELLQVAVRVSGPEKDDDEDDSIIGSLVKTLTADDEDNVAWYEINGGDGPSRAVISTKNAKVSAGFVGEGNASTEKSCVVM